jgi:hypothetical protein
VANLSRIEDHPEAVWQAVAEHDKLGRKNFLSKYEFRNPSKNEVEHNGKSYPARAIIGVAYKTITGEPLDRQAFVGGTKAAIRYLLPLGFKLVGADLEADYFDSPSEKEARRRISREILQRNGQPQFREKLLKAYRRRCAISGCDCVDALEAAHIVAFSKDGTNKITNGILLRSDFHKLFDLNKIAIGVEHEKWAVLLTKDLLNTNYASFHGRDITKALPSDRAFWPNVEAVKQHREKAGL